MTVQIAEPGRRGLENFISRQMVRLYDPTTDRFLHLSGRGTTKTATFAWLGFPHQARTLQQRAEARGETWPFIHAARDLAAEGFTR